MTQTEENKAGPQTAPPVLQLILRGIDNDPEWTNQFQVSGIDITEWKNFFLQTLEAHIRELSTFIDLSNLDGVTVAADYKQALLEVDRGYETEHRLRPTEDLYVGVAMTPAVLRDGKLKSHIVMNASFAASLTLDPQEEGYQLALHMLAHECAHVEVADRFDAAFPGSLLRQRYDDLHAAARWDIILGTWDEYAVTFIAAPFGKDPTSDYEETFIDVLRVTRERANESIKAYRLHGDHGRIMHEVYGEYGRLMKIAAYHIGNMARRQLSQDDMPKTKVALEEHWFAPHFARLIAALDTIAEGYGSWTSKEPFEALGDIADNMVTEGGVLVSHRRGEVWIDVPHTPETTPSARG